MGKNQVRSIPIEWKFLLKFVISAVLLILFASGFITSLQDYQSSKFPKRLIGASTEEIDAGDLVEIEFEYAVNAGYAEYTFVKNRDAYFLKLWGYDGFICVYEQPNVGLICDEELHFLNTDEMKKYKTGTKYSVTAKANVMKNSMREMFIDRINHTWNDTNMMPNTTENTNLIYLFDTYYHKAELNRVKSLCAASVLMVVVMLWFFFSYRRHSVADMRLKQQEREEEQKRRRRQEWDDRKRENEAKMKAPVWDDDIRH